MKLAERIKQLTQTYHHGTQMMTVEGERIHGYTGHQAVRFNRDHYHWMSGRGFVLAAMLSVRRASKPRTHRWQVNSRLSTYVNERNR